ncbi:hexosyltransferase [Trypanosoma cruzi]|nr:hexosyltransferase [Trypanosoma cruzi]
MTHSISFGHGAHRAQTGMQQPIKQLISIQHAQKTDHFVHLSIALRRNRVLGDPFHTGDKRCVVAEARHQCSVVVLPHVMDTNRGRHHLRVPRAIASVMEMTILHLDVYHWLVL